MIEHHCCWRSAFLQEQAELPAASEHRSWLPRWRRTQFCWQRCSTPAHALLLLLTLVWEDKEELALMPEFLQQPSPATLQDSRQSLKEWCGQLWWEHALAVQNVALLCLPHVQSPTELWECRLWADLPLESHHHLLMLTAAVVVSVAGAAGCQKIHLLELPAAMGLREELLPSRQGPAWLRRQLELAHLALALFLILQMRFSASEAVACYARLPRCPRYHLAQRFAGLVVVAQSLDQQQDPCQLQWQKQGDDDRSEESAPAQQLVWLAAFGWAEDH